MTRQRARRPASPATRRVDDWRVFRPAIWLGMLGIAILVLNVYAGILVVGAAIGIGTRIQTGRRRVAAGRSARRPRRR